MALHWISRVLLAVLAVVMQMSSRHNQEADSCTLIRSIVIKTSIPADHDPFPAAGAVRSIIVSVSRKVLARRPESTSF